MITCKHLYIYIYTAVSYISPHSISSSSLSLSLSSSNRRTLSSISAMSHSSSPPSPLSSSMTSSPFPPDVPHPFLEKPIVPRLSPCVSHELLTVQPPDNLRHPTRDILASWRIHQTCAIDLVNHPLLLNSLVAIRPRKWRENFFLIPAYKRTILTADSQNYFDENRPSHFVF